MDREQLRRDIDQFAALAPTLGQHAQRETPFDVAAGIDQAIGEHVTIEIDASREYPDALVIESDAPEAEEATTGPGSFEEAGFRCVDVTARYRRDRIRRAARARKARRGWR